MALTKEQMNRGLAVVGLLSFGGASITANVLSVQLPALTWSWNGSTVAAWQAMPKVSDVDGWAYFWAVLFPIAALMGIEFVSRFTGLHKVLRFGVLGLASLVAVVSSYLHIVHVLLWYGQGVLISIIGPVAVDGLMILCTMEILSTVHVRTDAKDNVPADSGQDRPRMFVVPLGCVPAAILSAVPYGPVPAVPVPPVAVVPTPRVSRDSAPKDNVRSSWDRAEAARLIMGTDLDNHQIGERVGTSYKTIQRLRREIRDNPAMVERS